jgi:hypothetical protein
MGSGRVPQEGAGFEFRHLPPSRLIEETYGISLLRFSSPAGTSESLESGSPRRHTGLDGAKRGRGGRGGPASQDTELLVSIETISDGPRFAAADTQAQGGAAGNSRFLAIVRPNHGNFQASLVQAPPGQLLADFSEQGI